MLAFIYITIVGAAAAGCIINGSQNNMIAAGIFIFAIWAFTREQAR